MAAEEKELKERFNKASAFLKTISANLTSQQLLYFYARFKQANEGPCSTPKPGFFDFQGKQKWEAWMKLKEKSSRDAMSEYVDALTEADAEWEEIMDSGKVKAGMGQAVSTMQREEPQLDDAQKSVFDWCIDGNIAKVKECIQKDAKCLLQTDGNGMTLCHWTCDRGNVDMLRLLLGNGIDVNAQDVDGQTPLHYAASCEHEEVVRVLLSHSADKNIRDSDGLLPSDATESPSISSILSPNIT